MKYYVVRYDEKANKKEYQRYKCLDTWTTKKEICWQFSKQGATAIVKRLNESESRRVYKIAEWQDGKLVGVPDPNPPKIKYFIEQAE